MAFPALTTGNQQERLKSKQLAGIFLIIRVVETFFYSPAKKDKGRKCYNIIVLKPWAALSLQGGLGAAEAVTLCNHLIV